MNSDGEAEPPPVTEPDTVLKSLAEPGGEVPPAHTKPPMTVWLVPLVLAVFIGLGAWLGTTMKPGKSGKQPVPIAGVTATATPTAAIPTPEPTAVPDPATTPEEAKSIFLTAQKQDNRVVLDWRSDGIVPGGYVIIWSQNEDPVYPPREGDLWYHSTYPMIREFTLDGLEGKYYFRVCEYLEQECGGYSNTVSLEL